MYVFPQILRRLDLYMLLENNIRVFLFLLGLWGALFGPWWLALVSIILLSLRFRAWEVLVLGLLVDLLWLPAGWHWPYFLITSIVVVWVFEPLRKELLLS